MFHYSPSSEPATERAFLVTLTEPEHGWAHLQAKIVRRAKPHIEGEGYVDDGKAATGWRNACWSNGTKSAIFIEDFTVRAQMDVPAYKPYGSDICFLEYGTRIDRDNARRMNETFVKVDKGLEKLAATFGSIGSDDFAGLLLRVADVLKIRTFLFHHKRYPSTGNLDTAIFREAKPDDVKWFVESLLESKQPKQEEESA